MNVFFKQLLVVPQRQFMRGLDEHTLSRVPFLTQLCASPSPGAARSIAVVRSIEWSKATRTPVPKPLTSPPLLDLRSPPTQTRSTPASCAPLLSHLCLSCDRRMPSL